MEPLITLTTDFGGDSPYVAAMKGVIVGLNPRARIIDLSHQIPPQDARFAAFFLRASIPYFPPEAIHLIVVDPGVGTDRALLYVVLDGHRLLAPDNGCWTGLIRPGSRPPTVFRLTERRFWQPTVSPTFHGRDILAPVAAHLSLGEDARKLGQPFDDWVRLEIPAPIIEPDRLVGEVIFIDHFGNLITNIPGEAFARMLGRPVQIVVGDQEVSGPVRTYAEAEKGTLVALVSSFDLMEVAVTGGSAENKLGARVGNPVSVRAVMPPDPGT
jgi:S-adenosyl-L-methionine hydrolase (adenosine-forming)